MNKGLEALENIKGNCDLFDEGYQWDSEFSKQFDEDIDIIEKELKALEIIKNKNVMISLLKGARSLEHYNIQIEPFSRFDNHLTIVSKIPMSLTQEEYVLIKKVLL